MTIYGIPNCNTVKKALDWIRAQQIPYEFHDFKKKGITAEKLEQWFKTFGWEQVINKKGLTFKKLSKEEQAAINNPDAAKAYLLENTSAIKRPVVEQDGKSLIGFNEADYATHLK